MSRRWAAVVLAGVAVLGVAGCGGRGGAAAPVPSSSASAPPAVVAEAAADDVASAVEEAEKLLDSIDAELAQDETDAG